MNNVSYIFIYNNNFQPPHLFVSSHNHDTCSINYQKVNIYLFINMNNVSYIFSF